MILATLSHLLLLAAGTAIGLMIQSLWRRRRQRRLDSGKAPWARVRAVNLWGDSGGFSKHTVIGVSRHHIAESGLTCPVCSNLVAERADYTRVQRMRINGVENEVIECVGLREVENNRTVACGTFLAASPDTEHGDHLDDAGNVVTDGAADRPEFFRFKRISREQATTEQYDASVYLSEGGTEDESLKVKTSSKPANQATTRKHDVLAGEELQAAIRAELAREQAPDTDTTSTAVITLDPKLADTRKLPVVTPPP